GIKGVVREDKVQEIQAQFNGGIDSAGRTTVVQADQISYVDTSGSPRDLLWGELSRATRQEIAAVFGVPVSVMAGATGETFDNADADYTMFWLHRMKSLLGDLDDQLDILTIGGFEHPLTLEHKLCGVWAPRR